MLPVAGGPITTVETAAGLAAFFTALIGIESDVVGDWATRRQIPYTTYRDLTTKTPVIELIQGVVDEVNQKTSHLENIRKFRLIPKELDHEDGDTLVAQADKAVEGLTDELGRQADGRLVEDVEDAHQARTGNGPAVFATLRNTSSEVSSSATAGGTLASSP